MEPNMKLRTSKFPLALAQLTHSNQFLKINSVVSMGFSILVIALAFFLAKREPVVIAMTPKASLYESIDFPKPEEEVTQAIKAYIERRYQWEPKTVARKLKEAEAFIGSQSRKAYGAAVVEVSRFSVEKNVSQRAYPVQISIELKKQTAFVSGDRVTAIQGLKAAGDLKLELSFESGPRTKDNPWGIYITKEKEG